MAVRDIFKVSWRTFFNPGDWIGYTELRSASRIIWGNVRVLFNVPVPERRETFKVAMKRLQVTEKEVQKIAQNYLLYSIVFVILSAISFATSFYMLFEYHSFFSWLFSILVTILFLAQALRFHFWFFQIKHRKLGCTFKEWWRGKPNKGRRNDK